jgi:CubicO group peptidase (beta-lactamase class C family)
MAEAHPDRVGRRLAASGPAQEHGGPFRYHSANTDLLGWMLERATSKKVQDLLSERLWTRIAVDDAVVTLDWAGFARGAGGSVPPSEILPASADFSPRTGD